MERTHYIYEERDSVDDDDEKFCPGCFAGTDSSEHYENDCYPHDDETCRQNSIDAESFPDLCRQVASLQGERDELRATVARVKALADEWETSVAGTPPFKSGTQHYLTRLREALAGDQP